MPVSCALPGFWEAAPGLCLFANHILASGDFCVGIPIPESIPLERRETTLEGEDKKEDRECFLRFMRKMLQWEPEKRSSAGELAEDEWILKHTT